MTALSPLTSYKGARIKMLLASSFLILDHQSFLKQLSNLDWCEEKLLDILTLFFTLSSQPHFALTDRLLKLNSRHGNLAFATICHNLLKGFQISRLFCFHKLNCLKIDEYAMEEIRDIRVRWKCKINPN